MDFKNNVPLACHQPQYPSSVRLVVHKAIGGFDETMFATRRHRLLLESNLRVRNSTSCRAVVHPLAPYDEGIYHQARLWGSTASSCMKIRRLLGDPNFHGRGVKAWWRLLTFGKSFPSKTALNGWLEILHSA